MRKLFLLQYACDMKSWLGPFTGHLVSSALENLTLGAHISGVRRTISKYNVCACKLKISKYAYELKRARYSIASLLCLVKRGHFFETHDRKLCFSPHFLQSRKLFHAKMHSFLDRESFCREICGKTTFAKVCALNFAIFSSCHRECLRTQC